MREATSASGPPIASLLRDTLDRDWVRLVIATWLVLSAFYFWHDWGRVYWLGLGDTDDNVRLAQVRALLAGQDWYDLRQYRLNPPVGYDIHWSRLVDLPIAGLILFFRLFTTPAWAEKLACGIAPLLPLSVAMLGLAATVRRLVSPYAWPLAILFMVGSVTAMQMYMPERIDHHGWQIAMLSVTIAGLCDPKGPRGGALVGLASAVSLTIGLEMLPFSAGAGAILALRWVWSREERPRLTGYAAALGGGSAAGYAGFASYADRVARCDALTPVWLSVMVVASALLILLASANPARRGVRFGLAVLAGAVIAAGFAAVFPQCLGRPEQVSPELAHEWLNNIREAKPIFSKTFREALAFAALPVIGLIGACVAAWRERTGPNAVGWAAVALFTAFGCAMMAWQIRAAPGTNLLAIPGAVALAWVLLPRMLGSRHMLVRVLGTFGAIIVTSGLFGGLVDRALPQPSPDPYLARVNRAGRYCMAQPALAALDRYRPATIFTFVDIGPRLIVLTHHSAVAGPYHRNGDAILDVQHAFQGTPEAARATMHRHGANLLLVCPNIAESTVYRFRAPGGFYSQLAHHKVFAWLTPLPLPKDSPYVLYKVS